MDKNVIRIFILGFIWVIAGIVMSVSKENSGNGSLLLAIGLSIESVALMLFFWKKINKK
ncbi:hypothetical protein [Flavicella sediminum]|uniref:hypothetical protein n=1 Tax=Flavicella sediminum TaxID=2585141 RepID=UPI00140D4A78|nr:hypothetical protein [Flavicella sediminum]